jgi:hypothetical protein
MNAGSAFQAFGSSVVASSTSVGGFNLKLPTTMRATPTVNVNALRIYDGGATPAVTSINSSLGSTDIIALDLGASGGGLTTGRCGIVGANSTTSAWVDASAEL